MQENKLHLEDLPQLVVTLLEKIERLDKTIQALCQNATETTANDDLMTIDEAAVYLHLTKNTLYRKVSNLEIPVSKLDKKLYFRKGELAEWVAKGRRKTGAELSADAEIYMANRYAGQKKTHKP